MRQAVRERARLAQRARVVERRHDPGRTQPGNGVAGDERRRDERRVDLEQREEAREEKHDQRQRAVTADRRVAHDFEHALSARAAAKTVDHVAPAVFVQRTGEDDGQRDRRQHGQRLGPEERGQRVGERRKRADDESGERKVAHRAFERGAAVPTWAGQRQAREETDGADQGVDFPCD